MAAEAMAMSMSAGAPSPEVLERVARVYARLDVTDAHALLGVAAGADAQVVQRAYALRKAFYRALDDGAPPDFAPKLRAIHVALDRARTALLGQAPSVAERPSSTPTPSMPDLAALVLGAPVPGESVRARRPSSIPPPPSWRPSGGAHGSGDPYLAMEPTVATLRDELDTVCGVLTVALSLLASQRPDDPGLDEARRSVNAMQARHAAQEALNLERQERWHHAAQAWIRAGRLNPDDPWLPAHASRAAMLSNAPLEDAARLARVALQLDPSNPLAQTVLARASR